MKPETYAAAAAGGLAAKMAVKETRIIAKTITTPCGRLLQRLAVMRADAPPADRWFRWPSGWKRRYINRRMPLSILIRKRAGRVVSQGPKNRRGGPAKVARHRVRRERGEVLGKPLPALRVPDEHGSRADGLSGSDVAHLVPDHPRRARIRVEVSCRREEESWSGLPAGTVRENVMRAHIDFLDPGAHCREAGHHLVVDPPKLALGDQLPSDGVLIRNDRDAESRAVQVRDRLRRPGQEFEVFRRAHVPGPAAVDDPVSVEEHDGALGKFHPWVEEAMAD